MTDKLAIVALCSLVAIAGCKKSSRTSSEEQWQTHASNGDANVKGPRIEACSLITKEEVGAVQNTTISDTKNSQTSDGSHLITQCYYASTGPNLSVSLTLTQPDGTKPGAPGPREYWMQVFGPYRNPAKEQGNERKEAEEKQRKGGGERGEEGEERKTPPQKIEDVGEEAFWTGTRFGGALYVLHKDYILRISVGGPADQNSKIDKSKELARKALSRL